MKNKILKIVLCLALTSTVFLSLAIPSFAFVDSFIGADNYVPNTASMTVNYLDSSKTALNPGRLSLNGFVNYTGGSNSSRNSGLNQTRTFVSTNDRFGYDFTLAYAAEAFLDFGYIRYSSTPLPQSNRFAFYLSFDLTDPLGRIPSDNAFVNVGVTYFTSNFVYDTAYESVSASSGLFNLNDILPQDVIGICKIHFGFNFSSYFSDVNEDYYPYVDGQLLISNFSDWKRLEPFKNSSSYLYSDSYNYGYNTAIQELDGGSLNDAFNRGYENGYSFGYQQGQIGEYNKGFDAGKNQGISEGYATGQQAGYNQGYATGLAQLGPEKLASYNEGYAEGYDIGHDDGYHQGYDLGVADDRDRAFQEGYEEGEHIGYEDGYNDGVTDGMRFGEEEGYAEGYDDGYTDGISESIDDMGLFSYVVSSVGAVLNIPLGDHFTLGGILAIIVAIPLLALMLKLFSGGD